MKILIAIVTCHKFYDRAMAQRNTWIKRIDGLDYRFFLSNTDRKPLDDEVFLDVPDDYLSLSLKVKAVMKWALEHDYDAVLKCDDDTFIFPDRLLRSLPTTLYEGRINRSNQQLVKNGWCSGFAYWLTGRSINLIANATQPELTAEDLWVGVTLSKHNIFPKEQPGFIVLSLQNKSMWSSFRNQVIATCEFPGSEMIEIDYAMMNNVKPHERTSLSSKRVMKFGEVLRRRK